MLIPKHLAKVVDEKQIPISASIELTRRCNWECVHCYALPEGRGRDEELTTDQLRDVLDQLNALGVFFLSFTGGEPTLREDLPALVRHANEIGMAVTLLTNASILSPGLADELTAAGIIEFQIPLLGASAASHDAISRRPGSRDRLWQGIEALAERRANLLLKTPVMRANYPELDELHQQATARGLLHMASPILLPRWEGDAEIERLRVTDEEMSVVFSRQASWIENAGDTAEPPATEEADGPPCRAGVTALAIGADGKVYPCQNFPLQAAAGDCRTDRLETIWREAAIFQRLRAAVPGRAYRCPVFSYMAARELSGCSAETDRICERLTELAAQAPNDEPTRG